MTDETPRPPFRFVLGDDDGESAAPLSGRELRDTRRHGERLSNLKDANMSAGDKGWGEYGDDGKGTVLRRYQETFRKALGEKSIQDYVDNQNENGLRVSIDLCGPGHIFTYLKYDRAVAVTLEDLRSEDEKRRWDEEQRVVVSGDINNPEETLGQKTKNALQGELASSIFCRLSGGTAGLIHEGSIEDLRLGYNIINNTYKLLSFNNGALLAEIQIPDYRQHIFKAWIKKCNEQKGVDIQTFPHGSGLGKVSFILQIIKGKEAPQDLPMLF